MQRLFTRFLVSRSRSAVLLMLLLPLLGKAQQSITALNSAYNQSFDSFAGTLATQPANWTYSGTDYTPGGYYNRATAYANSNSTYGLRENSTSTDVCFGAKLGSSEVNNYDLTVVNNTGGTITSFSIVWDVEQYSQDTRPTSIDFTYNLNGGAFGTTGITGTTLTSATVGATPTTNLAAVAVTNRSITITGISLGAGQNAVFRYTFKGNNGAGANGHIGIDNFALTATGGAATAPTIATGNPTAGTPVCATSSANITVPFTSTGTITGTYTVELSSASGSFATPLALTTTGSASPLTATIPAGTANGAGYKVRVTNSAPATTGTANATAFTIVSSPTASIAPTASQTYVAGAAGSPLAVTETPAAASNTRVWQFSNTSGGPYTTVAGQPGTSYTPTFAAAGTYYVVATSTFAACAAVTSNEVLVTVNPAPANTIGTPTFAAAPVCATAAAPLDVTFTASGTYDPTNTFTVLLSDAAGSFGSPTTIATLPNNNLTTAQTVTASIPAGTANGTGYRIQVVASTPAATSTGTSAALTIVGAPTVAIAPAATQNVLVGANGSVLTVTETPASGTTRVWQYATVPGGPYTTVAGQTGTSYMPTFATVGTYYVVATSTIAACTAVISNEVQVNVNNPVPVISSLTPNSGPVSSTVTTLTVNGTNFVSGAVVSFNGSSLTTTFVSATQLTVANVALPATAGPYNVTVANPTPGGGASAAAIFTVTPPVLVTYSTATLSGTTTSVSPTAPLTANVTASTITRGAGVTAASISGGFSSSSWTTSPTLDTSTNDYITLTAAPTNNFQLAISSIVLNGQRTAAGPTIVQLLYSTNAAFTSPVSLGTGTMAAASTDFTFTFTPAGGTLQAVTGTLYFRLYGYAASSTGNYILRNTSGGTNALTVYGTVSPAPISPEINLAQGGTSLPSTTGSYAFPTTGVATSTAAVQFDIQNLGTAALTLSGAPTVAISGDVADFTLTQPANASVVVGGSEPFTIAFSPASAGTKTATISIANDDSDENPYTFTVTGTPLLLPVVSSFTPAAGQVGTQVTVTGSEFTPTSTVAFNGTPASVVTVNSATSLVATVPSGATTGPVAVTNSVGTGTSSTNFTVTLPQDIVTGTLLLEDDFAYAATGLLTAHGWTAYSAAATAPIATVAGNHTLAQYPRGFAQTASPATFTGSSAARLTSTGQDVSRAVAIGSATTLYASAVVNVVNPGTAGSYIMTFRDAANASGGGDYRGRVFVQQSGAGFKFGLSLNSSVGTYTSAVYPNNTPYLVVVKVNTGTAVNTASLFVYATPADATEPAIATLTASGSLPPSSTGSLNAIVLRQDDGEVQVDGIRVATGWGTVIGRPVFTAPAATIGAGNYYSLAQSNADVLTPAGAISVEGSLSLTSGTVKTSATNSLTLYSDATISGGSSSSFVNGPLARVTGPVAATVDFPIGAGTAFRPLTLTSTAQTSTTTYTAEQKEGIATDQTLNGGLKRVSGIRSFSVTPDVQPTGFSGTIKLSFEADDQVTDPTALSLVIAKSDGSGWNDIGRSTSTGMANAGTFVAGSLTSAPFTSFSDFALASTDPARTINPLPVQLTAFSAQRQADNGVAVQWNTASEKNSAYFDVQRSLDGREFARVATTPARGTSSQPSAYAMLDRNAPAARLYYRLRQVDTDGTTTFSPVVSLAGWLPEGKIPVYPNPARGTISFLVPEATPYRVLSTHGQTLLRGTAAAGTTTVPLDAVASGLYFLELSTSTGRVVQKFEKE